MMTIDINKAKVALATLEREKQVQHQRFQLAAEAKAMLDKQKVQVN